MILAYLGNSPDQNNSRLRIAYSGTGYSRFDLPEFYLPGCSVMMSYFDIHNNRPQAHQRLQRILDDRVQRANAAEELGINVVPREQIEAKFKPGSQRVHLNVMCPHCRVLGRYCISVDKDENATENRNFAVDTIEACGCPNCAEYTSNGRVMPK